MWIYLSQIHSDLHRAVSYAGICCWPDLAYFLSGKICRFPIATNHTLVRTKLTGPANSLGGQNTEIKCSQREYRKAVGYMEAS